MATEAGSWLKAAPRILGDPVPVPEAFEARGSISYIIRGLQDDQSYTGTSEAFCPLEPEGHRAVRGIA